jgi:hypothetical protein
MIALRRVFLYTLMSPLLSPAAMHIGAIELSSLNWDRLNAGEAIVQTVENQNKIPGIRLFFIVAAPRETIWKTLIDYENFPLIFQGTKSADVKAQDESGADVEIKYSKKILSLFDSTYTYVLRRNYKIPGELLTWRRKSGDFKVIEGSWEIKNTDQPDFFLLVYESYLDGSWFFPAHLVQEMAIKEAVGMSQHVRRWMERRER